MLGLPRFGALRPLRVDLRQRATPTSKGTSLRFAWLLRARGMRLPPAWGIFLAKSDDFGLILDYFSKTTIRGQNSTISPESIDNCAGCIQISRQNNGYMGYKTSLYVLFLEKSDIFGLILDYFSKTTSRGHNSPISPESIDICAGCIKISRKNNGYLRNKASPGMGYFLAKSDDFGLFFNA